MTDGGRLPGRLVRFWTDNLRHVGSPRTGPARPSLQNGQWLLLVCAALFLLQAIITTGCGTALTWDGAWLAFRAIDSGSPALPHGRYALALLQGPSLIAAKLTSNVRLIELAFGAPYSLVPFVSVFGSWCLVRRDSQEWLVWPLMSSSLAVLPGQVFIVTEAIMVVQLAWPVLFALHRADTLLYALVAAAFGAFIGLLHPLGDVALLAFGVGLGFGLLAPRAAWPRRLLLAGPFIAGGAWRLHTSECAVQDIGTLSLDHLRQFAAAVNFPAIGVLGGFLAYTGVFLLVFSSKSRVVALWLAAAGLLLVGAAAVPWARSVSAWQDAPQYRYLVPVVAAPLFVGAILHMRLGGAPPGRTRTTLTAGAASVALCSLILALQGFAWLHLRRSFLEELRRGGPCIAQEALVSARNSPLHWWPTPVYALWIQGRSPASVVSFDGMPCRASETGDIRLVPYWTRARKGPGWFDMSHAGPESPTD
jgi:hypothetical protein